MQEATGVPSSHTVQAEQAPRSQPILVPVRSSGPRNTSASVALGSTLTSRVTPFTVNVIETAPGPAIAGFVRDGRARFADQCNAACRSARARQEQAA